MIYNAIMVKMKRKALIKHLAAHISEIRLPHPVRIAIDGVDAAGKTFFADELSTALSDKHRQVIKASVDGFHYTKTIRHQRGSLSPEGFYFDSFDYSALINNLLTPLGPGGNCAYRTATFDLNEDKFITTPPCIADRDAILIMEGIFLLRPILFAHWDLTIFLHADFKVTLQRGVARDADLFGSSDKARARYLSRYIPGQKIYLEQVKPLDKADVLIDNSILDKPILLHTPFESLSD